MSSPPGTNGTRYDLFPAKAYAAAVNHRAAERRGGSQRRWRFTGIAADSVTWRAATSHDEGATWHFDEQNAGHPS
ncbi:MAG TPA: hypothetical protein VF940_24710 [Streptosporangiaceae bacterium]